MRYFVNRWTGSQSWSCTITLCLKYCNLETIFSHNHIISVKQMTCVLWLATMWLLIGWTQCHTEILVQPYCHTFTHCIVQHLLAIIAKMLDLWKKKYKKHFIFTKHYLNHMDLNQQVKKLHQKEKKRFQFNSLWNCTCETFWFNANLFSKHIFGLIWGLQEELETLLALCYSSLQLQMCLFR